MIRQEVAIKLPGSRPRAAACTACGRPFLRYREGGDPYCSPRCGGLAEGGNRRLCRGCNAHFIPASPEDGYCSRSCRRPSGADRLNCDCIVCGTRFRKRTNTSTCSPECRITNRHGTLLMWKRVIGWENHPREERRPCPMCSLSRSRSVNDCGEECAKRWLGWKLRVTTCLFQCGAHTGDPRKLLCDTCIGSIRANGQSVGAWLCWEEGEANHIWFPVQRAQALSAVSVCVLCDNLKLCSEWGKNELRGVWGPWWAGSSAITRPR